MPVATSMIRRLLSVSSMQILLIIVFLLIYSMVMFRLAGPQQECLSVRDFADQLHRYELRMDAAGFLHRLAASADSDGPGRPADVRNASRSGDRRDVDRESVVDEDQLQRRKVADTKAEDERSFYVFDGMPVDQLLDPEYAQNKVYFVWCGRRWFEFTNYLSVMSVIRHLRPDNIVFCYDNEPILDSWTYNTWYMEIAEKYPFFRRHQLQPDEPGCKDHSVPNMTWIRTVLAATGGMYVHERTVLGSYPLELRRLELVVATASEDRALGGLGVPALLATKPRVWAVPVSGSGGAYAIGNSDASTMKSEQFRCAPSVDEYVRAHRKLRCVVVGGAGSTLFPKDIWDLDNSFGRLARTIFYGTPNILRPQPSYDTLVPNIAHIVWLGGGEMDFLFYLCVTSLIYVAHVDAVYIHGDGPPIGPYWPLIKDHPRLHLIYRQSPVTVYGNVVNVLSHVTDVWRVDFMVKYGGIYVDTDTVFVRPLDRAIRGYEAVGSYDWTYWNHPFPDTINFGVALGKRNAPYWHKFQESMKWFMDKDWSWNGLRQPYRIKERHPDLVLIDPRLQVICYQSLCHPTWWPDYHNESIHHLNSNSITDWRRDVFVFHWTLPTPHELKDHVNMLTTNSMFSDIARYVLEKAGTLGYFEELVQKGPAAGVTPPPEPWRHL